MMKISLCPFCNGKAVLYGTYGDISYSCWVYCKNEKCKAKGPEVDCNTDGSWDEKDKADKKAVRLWNNAERRK